MGSPFIADLARVHEENAQKRQMAQAEKYQISAEQRADQRQKLLGIRTNLQTQINSYPKDAKGNVLPEYKDQYDKAMAASTQNEYDWGQLYDPIENPGALQADWHWLREKLHGIKPPPSTTTQTPAITIPSAAGPITTPEMPAYQQTTPRMPSQGGPITTNVPGVPSTTIPGMTPSAPPLLITQSFADKDVPGLVAQGNLDLSKRPNIDNGDGTHSSTFSMSFGTDKGEVLVPGVGDGKTYPERQLRVLYTLPDGTQKWAVSGNQPHNWKAPDRPTPQNNEALNQYQKTGKFFGIFKVKDDDKEGTKAAKLATSYGQTLHEDQEKYGNNGVTAHPVSPSGNITLPAGPPVTVTKAPPVPWAQGKVQKLKDKAMQKAQQEAGLLAAGAPLSQGQQDNALLQSKLQAIQADPQLSPEDKAEARRKLFGVSEKPNLKLYASPDGGTKAWLDASRPDSIPIGWTAYTPTGPKPLKAINTPGGPPYAVVDSNTGKVYTDPNTMPPEVKSVFDAATASYTAPINTTGSSKDALGVNTTHSSTKSRSGLPAGTPTPAGTGTSTPTRTGTTVSSPAQIRSKIPYSPQTASTNAQAYRPFNSHNPIDEAAQEMVNGGTDPSQMQVRGADRILILNRARELDPNFDPSKASGDYKYANDASTKNLLNYLNSLTGRDDKSGNLGELVNQSNTIDRTEFPPLNRPEMWASLETGDPSIAAYYTTITEVSDQVAKILQGGGSGNGTSDAKLQQATGLFDRGFTKDQISAVATDLRDLLANRKNAIIGNNYYLNKWYKNPDSGGGGSKGSRSLAAAMAKPFNKGESADEVQKHLESLGYIVTKP